MEVVPCMDCEDSAEPGYYADGWDRQMQKIIWKLCPTCEARNKQVCQVCDGTGDVSEK